MSSSPSRTQTENLQNTHQQTESGSNRTQNAEDQSNETSNTNNNNQYHQNSTESQYYQNPPTYPYYQNPPTYQYYQNPPTFQYQNPNQFFRFPMPQFYPQVMQHFHIPPQSFTNADQHLNHNQRRNIRFGRYPDTYLRRGRRSSRGGFSGNIRVGRNGQLYLTRRNGFF